MNFNLDFIPDRTAKNRKSGITMVMDKGLSYNQTVDLLSNCQQYIDFLKIGFGTAFVTPNLTQKIELILKNETHVYFGGTLFEAFWIRKKLDEYRALCKDYNLNYIEISDGSIEIDHKEKCKIINDLSKDFKVISEVGSKDAAKIIPPYKWIELMNAELEAGAELVIAESREAGNVGIYRGNGEVREGLVEEILTKIPSEKIIWEAPQKSQQLYFLQLVGCNVNLGNISHLDIIALEAMRIGLRGDSFHFYLNKNG